METEARKNKTKHTLNPKASAIQKPKPLPRGNLHSNSSRNVSYPLKRKKSDFIDDECEEEEDWEEEVPDSERPEAYESDVSSEDATSYSDLEEEGSPFEPSQKTVRKKPQTPPEKARFSPVKKKRAVLAKRSSVVSPQRPKKEVKPKVNSFWENIKQTTAKLPLFSDFQLFVFLFRFLFLLLPVYHTNQYLTHFLLHLFQ